MNPTYPTPSLKTLLAASIIAVQLATGTWLTTPNSSTSEDEAATPPGAHAITTPTFRIEADTVDQRQRARWARQRFALAGLALPDIEIRFHADESGCAGYQGLTTNVDDGEQIDVCRTNNYVILHELAHAWQSHTLDDNTRTSFQDLRGLTAWNDPTLDWNHRGTEHAANIIAWGLSEIPISPIGIHPNDPNSLHQAFQLLTGTTPLHNNASDPPATTLNQPPGS